MSANPAWRMGAGRYALALAGYYVLRYDMDDHPSLQPPRTVGEATTYSAGEIVIVGQPLLVVEGSLGVVEERLGQRPARVYTVEPGWCLVPISGVKYGHPQSDPGATRTGVRIEARGRATVLGCPLPELVRLCLHREEVVLSLVSQLSAEIEAQHWTLRLSAVGAPMHRLALLLLRIAEDRGVPEPEGLRLAGVPDARELAVLAGVSRESAVINLEALNHTRVIHREHGAVWVIDLDALRAAAEQRRNG